MSEHRPPYTQAWVGSFTDVQDLPKALRRGLKQALTEERADPVKFLVVMGRLVRFCDVGSASRRRARKAAAEVLSDVRRVGYCVQHSLDIALVFSRAFRALRYREGYNWEEEASPGMAIITVRDDLESMWQAVRHGIPVPDLVRDPPLAHALRNLRSELSDHIQTIDALCDPVLYGLVASDLTALPPDHERDYLNCMSAVEPLRWWLALHRANQFR